jgi:hypothetical protein
MFWSLADEHVVVIEKDLQSGMQRVESVAGLVVDPDVNPCVLAGIERWQNHLPTATTSDGVQ